MFSIHICPSIPIPFFLSPTSITLTPSHYHSNPLIPFHFIVFIHVLFLFWLHIVTRSVVSSLFIIKPSFCFHFFQRFSSIPFIPIICSWSLSYSFFSSHPDHFTIPPFILYLPRFYSMFHVLWFEHLLLLFISSVFIPLFVIELYYSLPFILMSTHTILSLLSFYPSSILQFYGARIPKVT